MTFQKWTDDDWGVLVSAIKKEKCILMLGPETAVEEIEGKQQLLSQSIACLLANDIEPHIKECIDTMDLMESAQYYCLKKGKNYLHNKIRNFYKERKTLTSDFHRNLAALPFYLTINTSLDHMFHTALIEQNKTPGTGWYNFKSKEARMASMGTKDEPMIFHLFGHVDHEESLVLTQDDLLDFLVSIVAKEALPENLLNELKASDKSFLFLGFGLRHWYLRIILHILEIKNNENHSFALEDFSPHSDAELKSTVLFYKEGSYNIHFFKNPFDQFAKELRQRCEVSDGGRVPVPDTIQWAGGEKPKVFICHASENKKVAASLSKKLEEAGLEPWLDKRDLSGGDYWDETIVKAIKEEVNYFLVLQSKGLESKVEGYVNKEITLAMERQQRFRKGTKFIIPLNIDGCNGLPELKPLQTFDLDIETNFQDLFRVIKKDNALRRRG